MSRRAVQSRIDGPFVLNNNEAPVEFTQSARRHKIGRGRVRQVIADPVVVVRINECRLPTFDCSSSGRALEVIAIEGPDRTLVVIHAMDLRGKYRALFEEEGRP